MNKKLKSIKSWFPIKNIENGIIETNDRRYCKVLEVFPINFELMSNDEKEAILFQYKAFLKTCNFDMQILMQSKKNNLEEHIEKILKINENEEMPKLKELINKYTKMIDEKTLKTTITRRFFIIFFVSEDKNKGIKEAAIDEINDRTTKIIKTLEKCGNEIRDFSNENFELIKSIYEQLNKNTSEIQKIKVSDYEKY